jgi:hypothetical protein
MLPAAHGPLARALVALAAACAAAATLAACGGSSASPKAAAAVRTAERKAEDKAETQFDDFARCLREHGINAEVRPGGHGLKIMGGEPAQMQAAEKACARYRPPEQRGPSRFSPQEKVELEDRLQRFAKCMREHGIEVEATVGTSGPQINIHPGASKPGSPAFEAGQKACHGLLPLPPGATPVPGGGA